MDTYSRKKVVDKYSLVRTNSKSVMEEYAKKVISYSKKGDKILEIGFGTGALLIPLSELSNNLEILGVDKSKNMVLKVQKQIGAKAKLYSGTLLSLSKKLNTRFNIIHFKAILHCIKNPEKELDLIANSISPGGYLITGHEISQPEDRLEQIFNYTEIDDPETELIFEYYFKLRTEINKPFPSRKFPAGDSWNTCEYLIKKSGFKLIEEVSDKKISWIKKFKINDILMAIKEGTFGVFYDGLNQGERNFLYKQLVHFTKKNKIDIDKTRIVPARYKIYILKKGVRDDN
jgi:ubiquinone/menaquinone biosynthesis C-methylase UbiE